MATTKTIWIKGDGLVKEAAAGGAITPGHLVRLNTSNQVVVHATAQGNAIPAFALEKDFVGKDITTAYVSGEQVQYLMPQRGAEVYALVPASAAAIVIGDYLESAGDGTLRKIVDDPAVANTVAVGNISNRRLGIVARAMEAVDNSGGGTPARIRVEVV